MTGKTPDQADRPGIDTATDGETDIDLVDGTGETGRPADIAATLGPEGALELALDRAARLEAEIEQVKDQALRAMAEAENVRRRTEREKTDALRYATAGLARDLVSVADNLRRALDAVPDAIKADEAARAFLSGIELTERELLAAFGKHAIRRIDPVDEPFDHNFHQAMFEVPGTGKANGTVVQCLQPGYVLHDRLLRPALVGVAKGDGAPAAPGATDADNNADRPSED